MHGTQVGGLAPVVPLDVVVEALLVEPAVGVAQGGIVSQQVLDLFGAHDQAEIECALRHHHVVDDCAQGLRIEKRRERAGIELLAERRFDPRLLLGAYAQIVGELNLCAVEFDDNFAPACRRAAAGL